MTITKMVRGVANLQEKPYYVLEGEGKSWFYMSKGLQASCHGEDSGSTVHGYWYSFVDSIRT